MKIQIQLSGTKAVAVPWLNKLNEQIGSPNTTYIVTEIEKSEFDGDIVKKLFCVELGTEVDVPPYLTIDNLKGWIQSSINQEVKIQQEIKLN